MVVLTVGNAYLLVLADESQVSSVEAQVATAKVSLDQAIANHEAGTAPLLDELRARVDYQSLEQQLIVAQNELEKDKLALARTIGLPLAQRFNLTDTAPYAAFDQIDVDAAIERRIPIARTWRRWWSRPKRPKNSARRPPQTGCPTLMFDGDYGDIGVTAAAFAWNRRCAGHVERAALQGIRISGRGGDCAVATGYAACAAERYECAGGRGCARRTARYRVGAEASGSRTVQRGAGQRGTQRSATALCQRGERQPGSQPGGAIAGPGQRSVCDSLYRHNVAKLSLARALGAAQNYKRYLGGK